MTLRFFDSFHGYSTNAATQETQMLTVYERIVAGSGTQGQGRFPGTTYFGANASSFFVSGKTFSVASTLVRAAIEYGNTSKAAERPVIAICNSNIAGAALATFLTNAATFFGLTQGTDGKFMLKKGGSTLATSTNAYTGTAQYDNLEIEANITASGTFKLYVNNTLEINYSGDLVGSVTGSPVYLAFAGGGSLQLVRYSKLVVWDDASSGDGFSGYLGDFRAVQLLPNAAGSSSQSTVTGAATRHEAVDDLFRNGDTDYVTLSNNGDKDLYNYSAVGITGPVISVVAQPSASLGGSGQVSVKAQCKSSAATAESAASGTLGTLSGIYGGISLTHGFGTDPNTGVAWTVANIDAAEFGASAVI